MDFEQKYFIRLLKDHVTGRESRPPKKMPDWDVIVRYAGDQNLAGIIYAQTKGFACLPEKAARRLKEGFLSDVYVSVNTDDAYRRIAELFDRNGIEYMPFKGALFRDYYPWPELRTMGDRDILIHPKDRTASDALIRSLGYERFVDNHAVWTYHKKFLMFEIHDVMFYEFLANQVDYSDYFSHIWESSVGKAGSFEKIPDINVHFLYAMTHTAKHVINKGMGFRAFLDMVFFVKNAETEAVPPDWEWVRVELEKLRLYDFTKTCFSLCEYWFGVKMPFHLEDPDPVFLRETTKKVFRDGIFGLKNEENTASRSAKEIRRSAASYRKTALGLVLKDLFPPYRNMQLVPQYAWVDKKPWLLPAAWVYRWFYCLKHKPGKSLDHLLEPYEKKEAIEARERYLERWGL